MSTKYHCPVAFRVDPATEKRVARAAVTLGVSKSDVYRMILKQGLPLFFVKTASPDHAQAA